MHGTTPGQEGAKALVTAEALLHTPDDGFVHELVRGEVRNMTPAGARHGVVASKIDHLLRAHVDANDLGVVGAADTGFVLSRNPDTVRAPDVFFVRRDRVPADGVPEEFWQLAPDLAVEVISASNDPDDMQAKVLEYLAAGTRMIWLVYPRTRAVTVYRSAKSIRLLSAEENLSGEDVLPGFSCKVADFF